MAVLIGQATSVLEWIVLLGAAAGALAVLHRQVMLPLQRFGPKASQGVDILLDFPAWRRTIELRLDALEQRLHQQHPRELDVHLDVRNDDR